MEYIVTKTVLAIILVYKFHLTDLKIVLTNIISNYFLCV